MNEKRRSAVAFKIRLFKNQLLAVKQHEIYFQSKRWPLWNARCSHGFVSFIRVARTYFVWLV